MPRIQNKLFVGLAWISGLSFLILLSAAISLSVGPAGIPLQKILPILQSGQGTMDYGILVDVRFPRILLGFAIGGALSLAGVMLQGMFRNPLVEPYTLGISGGAALGVSAALLLGLQGLSIWSMPLAGFLGAAAIILLVYFLSMREGRFQLQELLLTGVMVSFIASSLIMLIMALASTDDLHGIIFWIMGSLEEPNMILIRIILTLSIFLLGVSFFFSSDLNALSLGEEDALHLGVRVERTKIILFLLASLLTGMSVSAAGVIGFVGLVVPHFMRMCVGNDHRILLPASYLAGAVFLIFCDTLARTLIAPLELPVGVITGILGGSLFVWVLSKRKIG